MSTGPQFERADKLSTEQVISVRSALQAVISSDAFSGSKRCQDFLRLVVEHALAGELDDLHERMIGVEMFGRPVDYDTSNDAVVRVRATEVRKRLAQYYRGATPAQVVRIELPPGSYVPEFHWPEKVEPVVVASPPTVASTPLLRRIAAVVVVLLVIAVLVLIVSFASRPKSESAIALRLSLGLPQGVTLHRSWHPFEHIALSPDGQTLAFAATDASGQSSLWVRPLSSSEARRIDQSEGALLPFWSPDSQFIVITPTRSQDRSLLSF